MLNVSSGLSSSRILLIFVIGLILFLPEVTAIHWGLHVCPFHFARCRQYQAIRVVYGYPTPEAKALAGKVVLGGCRIGFVKSVCPYCKWPVELGRP